MDTRDTDMTLAWFVDSPKGAMFVSHRERKKVRWSGMRCQLKHSICRYYNGLQFFNLLNPII